MIHPIEIMKQAYSANPPFTKGSISELIIQEELAAAQDQIQEQEALDIAVYTTRTADRTYTRTAKTYGIS
jgi:hypothetical protein